MQSDVNFPLVPCKPATLIIQPKFNQCKRFVLHPHFPFIYLTISILGSSTIFGLSLKYTLRFVPSSSKPFRAYMVDNSSAPAAGARMFSISVGGSTTAIEQLESTADSKAEYYDLQGRRLQNLQKGVNIVKRGGKTMKVIIK